MKSLKLVMFGTLMILLSLRIFGQEQELIGHNLLIEDTRQLSNILENAHPDPYINGGGKIAYHLRLKNILESIPDSGMTKSDFFRLVAPLAASVHDAHTVLYNAYGTDWDMPGGIPLYFDVVENTLYVKAVPDSNYIQFIGATLISIEGLQLPDLITRQMNIKGCDNKYSALALLGKYGTLFQGNAIQDLIPEWKNPSMISVTLRLLSGKTVVHIFKLPVKLNYPFIKTPSKIELPSIKQCDFNYEFMNKEKKVALIRIKRMESYREDFELNATSNTMERLNEAWERYYDTKPPKNIDSTIAGIPSAAELFHSLVSDMKKNKSNTLIVDVRQNGGGNSLMADFLWYFLFGKEKYLWLKGETATDITKLSDLYFENRPNENIAEINQGSAYTIEKNDYDFRYYCYQNPEKLKSLNVDELMDGYFQLMPSFYKYYSKNEADNIYHPDKIIVLCSDETFSGGFELLWGLYKFGAVIVGSPSSQSGNFFSNALNFQLENSGLRGQISSKSQMLFPDDPEKGHILYPDYELTYAYLKSVNFDRNAELLYVLENLIPEKND